MDKLKITKMPDDEKIFWIEQSVYRSFQHYKSFDIDFKRIDRLQSSKDFYEISPKFAESYNISKLFRILKEKFNTEQLVLFAFYRYCGTITVEYMFEPVIDVTNFTYYLTIKDGDVIYTPGKNKAQKFMVAVNPTAAMDALPEDVAKRTKRIIAGKKIFDTFFKNSLDNILDEANKNLGTDTLYSKPLDIRRNDEQIQIYLDTDSMKSDIREQITRDIEKYLYDKCLKPYFKDLGQIPCKISLSNNPRMMSMFINFEELTNNLEA